MNEVSHDVKIMAGIGYVCLQYARLEIVLAGMIWALLDLDEHRGAIATGGMDLKARFGVALSLLEEMGAHGKMQTRLRKVQSDFRAAKMDERRNQAVHGAHKFENNAYTFTMLRYPKAQREQEVTPEQLRDLGDELCALGNQVYELLGNIEGWARRYHSKKNAVNGFLGPDPVPPLAVTEGLYARIQHFWRNLFG